MIEFQFWQYAAFGLLVGCYGTIVGLGGGFLVVPALMLAARFSAQQAAATSLVVVFANAVSGNISYYRQRRIDVATGWRFGLASVPGSLVGVEISRAVTNSVFKIAFGVILIASSIFLMIRPNRAPKPSCPDDPDAAGKTKRCLVDSSGRVYEYAFNMKIGLLLSFFAGIVSALFGVGGGIVYVPALVYLFCFPVRVATATSFFVLLISSLAGVIFHGFYQHTVYSAGIFMGAGAIVGAQVGAALSRKLHSTLIIRLFAAALLIVGIGLVAR